MGCCPSCFKKDESENLVNNDELNRNYQGHQRDLQSEINKEKRANGQLQQKVNQLEKDVRQLKDQAKQRDAQIVSIGQKRDQLRHELNGTQHTLKGLEQERDQLRHELNGTQHTLNEKQQRLDEAVLKLSAEMSSKVSADESSVENVSIRNRPINVAEEYQQACSDQWLEAKTELDEVQGCSEPEKITLLHSVIKCAEDEARKVHAELASKVRDFFQMLETFGHLADDEGQHEQILQGKHEKSREVSLSEIHLKKNIPTDLQNAIGDFLRNHSSETSLDKMKKAVRNMLDDTNNTQLWLKTKDTEAMNKYVSCMVRIAWKMAIQRPPMEFQYSDKWEGETKQELYWSSSRAPNAVAVEVYPMMFHSDSLMVKGKMFLYEQQ